MQHIVETRTLIKASFIALILAVLVLVSIILPAEYNIDPVGIGAKLGLTTLAQNEKESPVQTTNMITKEVNTSSDTIEIRVPAGKGVEYKFQMAQYAKLNYEWITGEAELYFDLHGEPEGDTSGYFESYTIATSNEMKGSFTTPFAGSHGWYWKNKTDEDIEVMLMVSGEYTVIGLKQ